MKILLTGSPGFVGTYIATHLEGSPEVYPYSRKYNGDLKELSAARQPFDIVIHCAAAAGPWHTTQDIIKDNIEATRHLVECATYWRTKLFIFLSSVSIYGTTAGTINENSPTTDPSPYGMSKLLCEKLLSESGLPTVSLRCPGIVGPNCIGRNWLARLANGYRAGKKFVITSPENQFNSVVHVADITKFIGLLLGIRETLQANQWNTPLILCADKPITVRNAAVKLHTEMQSESELEYVETPTVPQTLFSNALAKVWGFIPMTVEESIVRFASESRANR